MDPLFDLGLEATRWLQTTYPQLEGFFRFISQLGEEQFYLLLLPIFYWCLDKQFGRRLAYTFLMANGINVLGKHAFRGPRPFWLVSELGISLSSGYGVPSGHTQLTTVIYSLIASWVRRGWMWLLAFLMIVAMGMTSLFVLAL